MTKHNSLSCNCPSCSKPMQISALECVECDLTLKGKFDSNPIMKLNEEMLHFLHVFIVCEGKIADIEKALGISYPTVKNKIQKLKDSVSATDFVDKSAASIDLELNSKSVIEILELMNNGMVNYEKGLSLIKKKTEKKSEK